MKPAKDRKYRLKLIFAAGGVPLLSITLAVIGFFLLPTIFSGPTSGPITFIFWYLIPALFPPFGLYLFAKKRKRKRAGILLAINIAIMLLVPYISKLINIETFYITLIVLSNYGLWYDWEKNGEKNESSE